jgi:monoterpene epsilon-lactone hydrolase
MHPIRLAVLALAAALAAAPALAQDGVRHLPARDIPVPATVSPPMQVLIGAPLQPTWNEHPKTAQAWKALIDQRAAAVLATLPALRARLGVRA